jgi:hypothetical protein
MLGSRLGNDFLRGSRSNQSLIFKASASKVIAGYHYYLQLERSMKVSTLGQVSTINL